MEDNNSNYASRERGATSWEAYQENCSDDKQESTLFSPDSDSDSDSDPDTSKNDVTENSHDRQQIEPEVVTTHAGKPSQDKQATPDEREEPSTTDHNTFDTLSREDVSEDTEFVDLGVVQANYTVKSVDGGEDKAVIHLFCRRADSNDVVQVNIRGYKPYFYAPVSEIKSFDYRTDSRFPTNAVEYTDAEDEQFESIRGQKLAKIHAHIPKTVGYVKSEFDHYEADIQFPDRFLIDKGIKSGIRVPADWNSEEQNSIDVEHTKVKPIDVSIDLRVHTVDIEVEDRNGFPSPEDATEPIICLTSHDSQTNQYVVWYNNDREHGTEPIPDSLSEYDFINDGDNPTVDIRTFPSEEEMLAKYVAYVNGTNADLLVGWNFVEFDAEYIVNRIENIESTTEFSLQTDHLSRVNEVWSGGWKGPNIKGRVVFDLLEAYKRTKFTEMDSYRLDDIGEKELGIGKEVFDGDIAELWEDNPEKLIEYNLRDVEICVELDRQQDIIDFWNEVQHFVGCRLQDATTPGDAVDMYVLHKVNNRFVLPSKGTVDAGEEFEGGSVFDPITGIEEKVTVLDLKSLYPMCMTTINASPETKVDPDEYTGDTYHAPNGIHYRKDKDGIIREMVTELLEERENKKELRSEYDPSDSEYELYDRQQGAVKVIMNSLYGTLGWDRFRLYDKDNAAAVTATGRAVIKKTAQCVNELGYEITYGDTDSVMISLDGIQCDLNSVDITDNVRENAPDWSDDELKLLTHALNTSFEIEDSINESYNTFAEEQLNAEEHNFLIEFEKFYWRFLQAGKKKRYAGHIIWKEGDFVDKIDITGFEYKRSDNSPITKESQKKVIEMLVRDRSKEKVRTYISDIIDRYLNGEYSLDRIAIPGGIGQPLDQYDTKTAHVRGAEYANVMFGTNFGEGDKPKRVYLERVDSTFYRYCRNELGLESQTNPAYRDFKKNEDVICFTHEGQVPDEFEVDYEEMLSRTVKKPLSRVLQAVDLTWAEVKTAQQQTGLEQFM